MTEKRSIKKIFYRKQLLCQAKVQKTLWEKATGLMFHKPLRSKEGMLFCFPSPRKLAIHMWFVFFSLDIVFLDEEKRIVEIKENLKPWHYYAAKNPSQYFLELPAGTVKEHNLTRGATLSWEE